VINGQRRRVLRKKEVMLVLCWEKPFSASNGNVQVPWRKDQCPINLHVNHAFDRNIIITFDKSHI
jgi:hypothetical protein